MSKPTISLLLVCAVFGPATLAFAATIPAGTTIVVTTADALSSHENPGRTFKTTLARDLASGGKVVLPAGTVFFGVVETSRNAMIKTTTNPLTVNLTSAVVNGRRVPVKTTGGISPDTLSAVTPRQKQTGVSAGKSVVQHGTQLSFQLAKPLTI